jgi:short-subunit dehydrogenase
MSASNVLGKGRMALVTGASRGIGALIARGEGGHVVLTGRSAADLNKVTSELAAAGADVSFVVADLTKEERRRPWSRPSSASGAVSTC